MKQKFFVSLIFSGIVSKMDDKKTFREFFKTFNQISYNCFDLCVFEFESTTQLRGSEERCLTKCVTKYLSASKEIQKVFAEDQAHLISTGSVKQ